MSVVIERALESHWIDIYDIFVRVIETEDTFAHTPGTPEGEIRKYWMPDDDKTQTFVAIFDGNVVGSYIIRPNMPGLSSHICNCGYMVNPSYRGKGVAQSMCEHSLRYGKDLGYLGMQYNLVVSTNTRAVELWKRMGFRIIGTVPNGFRHKELGFVDTFVMFREL